MLLGCLTSTGGVMKFQKSTRTDKRNLFFLLFLGLFAYYEYGVGHFEALGKTINPNPVLQCKSKYNDTNDVIDLMNGNLKLIRKLRASGIDEIRGTIIILGSDKNKRKEYFYDLKELDCDLQRYLVLVEKGVFKNPRKMVQALMKQRSALSAELNQSIHI